RAALPGPNRSAEGGRQAPAGAATAAGRGAAVAGDDAAGDGAPGQGPGRRAELLGLLQEHRLDTLRFGAAGRLLVVGEVDAVLPLDEAELLDAARPIHYRGVVKADLFRGRARQDAQVRALQSGSIALIVLGGAHDLPDSMRALGLGRCEQVWATRW